MPQPATQRRLAAVLAADVVGYSRLMQQDDAATLAALTERRALFAERVGACGGRIVNAPGDSILAEFPSVLAAVECAVGLQRDLTARDADVAEERRMRFRIGVNLGDVLVDDAGIYGDGVNIAARLESLCPPGGVALSGTACEQVRGRLPLAFVDRGEHRVKNIEQPVRVYAVDLGAGSVAARKSTPDRRKALAALALAALALAAWLGVPRIAERLRAPAESGPPTVAVLPFANQSGDAKREYFSDGVTEDIINALGRFSGLRVMAASAVQVYKMRVATQEQVSRELGARYIVQGSVRDAGGRLRVGVELSDAAKGTLLWSERYEGEGSEVFEIQDQIVRNIAGTLAVKLTAIEQERATAKPPDNPQAYDLVLRARVLLAQALQLAPNYAEAYAALAEGEFQRAVFGWIEDPAEALKRSEEAAQRALAIGDPGAASRAHAVRGSLYTFTGKLDAALTEADRAIELNPSDALAHGLRGGTLLWLGRIDESIAASETARRYMPRLRPDIWFNLAMGYYLAGRYRDSAAACNAAIEINAEQTAFVHAVHAAALAQLGSTEEARRAAAEARRLDPFLKTELFGQRLVNPAHREAVREGLRKAGL
jgi:adenylate cyclase